MEFMTQNTEETPQIDLDRLAELMKEKKWKVSDLAYYSGINYNTVYAIVNARRTNPQSDNLNAIATALGVTPDYLLGRSEYRKPPKEKLPEQVRQLANIAGRLSAARQEELLRIAETLEEMERREPVYTISGAAMNELLGVLEKIASDSEQAAIAESLHKILGGTPNWLLSGRSGENGSNLIQH